MREETTAQESVGLPRQGDKCLVRQLCKTLQRSKTPSIPISINHLANVVREFWEPLPPPLRYCSCVVATEWPVLLKYIITIIIFSLHFLSISTVRVVVINVITSYVSLCHFLRSTKNVCVQCKRTPCTVIIFKIICNLKWEQSSGCFFLIFILQKLLPIPRITAIKRLINFYYI